MEKLIANLEKARNSNVDLFYDHKNEKSQLIFFIHKYWLINIQYICNIKLSQFKSVNMIKLSTNIRYIREAAKSIKIDINYLKIKVKNENCLIANIKDIISLL